MPESQIKGLPAGAELRPISGLPPGAELRPVGQQGAPLNASTDPSGRTPSGEPAPGDNRNMLQRAFDNMVTPDPRREEWQNPVKTGVDRFSMGVAGNVLPLIAHPLKSIGGAVSSVGHALANNPGNPVGAGLDLVRPMIESGVENYQQNGPAKAIPQMLGQGVGMWATGELGGAASRAVLPKVAQAGGAIRDAAIGDPNVAAVRAAGMPKKNALGFKADVQAARPYLAGSQSVEDVQKTAGIGGTARDEIYKPISDFLAENGDRVVQGPDGPTTLRDLEGERGQVSAQLRQLRAGGPEGIALATQKGLNQADLMARQSAIEGAMDPHLMGAGIDSPLIRQTYGQVARVGDQFAGRWTPAEKPTPYGFGRLMNVDPLKPRTWLGQPAQGVRDLIAGRPLWSGNAGDVGVGEAFRTGGPKPDFRAPASAIPRFEYPPRQLEANVPGNAGYGDIDAGSMAGIPHPGPQITPPPLQRFALPEITTPGKVQPMVKYATPYIEPFDPHLKPVDLEEYRNMFKKKEQ